MENLTPRGVSYRNGVWREGHGGASHNERGAASALDRGRAAVRARIYHQLSVFAVVSIAVSIVVLGEVEEVEQIAERWTIERHVRVVGVCNGVREVVAAAVGQGRQIPS